MLLFVRSTPSNGATALSKELGGKKITPQRLAARGMRPTDFLVNWGSSDGGYVRGRAKKLLNHPAAVATAVDKLATLRVLQANNVQTLDFGESYKDLRKRNPKTIIFARTLTRSSEGRGIKLVGPDEREVPAAPLYTAYFKKDWELRVHVFCGEPIHVQQKRRKQGLGDERTTEQKMIRSHTNGWVFCENDFNVSLEVVREAGALAVAAVKALKLDFGAVDILGTKDKMVVCEVNTKPGIESTNTLQAYVNALEKQLRIAK